MKILKVGIKNLNSLRMETSIDFMKEPIAGTGLFAITGDTGAGKTTILDAITLALYGKIHRNKEVKEVMSYGASDCFAEVEFESGDQKYFSKWSLHRAGKKADGNFQTPKRELSKWNPREVTYEIIAEKIKEVDQSVEEITGLDYDRFCRSVLLSQGDFAAFLKSGEKERSDLLERITGTEIYSQLSMAAFQRHKEEELKLKDLNQNLESLRVLDDDALKELNKDLKVLEKDSKSLKKELDSKQKQVNWLQKIEDLEAQMINLQDEIDTIEKEKIDAANDLARLSKHQKTVPFQTNLSKLDDFINSKTETENEFKKLNVSILEIENSEKTKKEKLDHLSKEYKIAKEDLAEKSKLFEEVSTLDIQIKEKTEPLQKSQFELQKQSDDFSQKQLQSKSLEERLNQLEQKFQEVSEWLKDNKIYKNLIDDLQTIKHLYASLRDIYKNEATIKKEVTASEELLKKEQKQHDDIQKKLEHSQKETKQLLSEFAEQAPEEFVQSRNELLNKLSEEIENLGTHNTNLQQLKSLNEGYQSLLKELSLYEEQLENLRQEEHNVNKEIMSSLEAMDSLQSQLEFKQQVYEEQLMIANYEKDRSILQDGKPCPLCFSKTHPFRKKQFKPFTDHAKKELDNVKKQFELFYQPHKNLLNRQRELEHQIEVLEGNEVKELNGQVQNQKHKLEEFESKISLIAPELSKTVFSLTRKSLLNLKISDFEKQLINRRKKRERLITLDSKLEKFEKSEQEFKHALKDKDLEIARIEENLKLNRGKLTSLQTNFEKTTSALNKTLKQYGFKFEIDSGDEKIDQKLEDRKTKFEQSSNQKIELKSQLDLCKQEISQLTKQIEKQKIEISDLKKDLETKSNVILELQNQRKTLFGDKHPETEKGRLQQNLLNLETNLEAAKTDWDEAILLLKTTKNSIVEKEKQLAQFVNKINQLEVSLSAACTDAGFENIENLRSAILSDEIASTIQKNSEVLKEKEIKVLQTLKNTETDLKNEKAKKLTEEPKQNIEEALADAETQFQQLQQGIGVIQEKINHNDQLKKEGQAILKKIENQRKEYNRWAKLNEVIGMADGKKFRVFAQGLTLKKLTILANKHLKLLNGRYFIYKRSDENLALDIIDTFQADNIRSMNTLSGGESFLVSLALALGLSDLAGRNTNINSLFIDEGFGSLDETTLDLAITTLENLQSKGKTIGVISHVKALKERISTQIMVKKKASGFSELEILG